MNRIEIEQRPIVLSKQTMDRLLKEPKADRASLVALYVFYYYTAVWQGTDRPKCTTSYAAIGTGMGTGKVKRLKKRLAELKLVKSCIDVGKDGKVIGHFVKVNYCHTRGSDNHPQVNRPGNALRTNNKSVHNKVGAQELFSKCSIRQNFYETCTVKLEEGLRKKKKITMPMNVKRRRLWANSFRLLYTKDEIPKKRIKQVLKWYISQLGIKFVPIAYTGPIFREKFIRIEEAMKRSGGDVKPSEKAIKISNWARQEFKLVAGTDIVEILPAMIEKSLQNYIALRAANKNIAKTYSRGPARIAKHLDEELFEAPTFFLRNWLKEIPHWNISKIVFDIDHQTLEYMAQKILKEFTGEATEWFHHKKVLNENL